MLSFLARVLFASTALLLAGPLLNAGPPQDSGTEARNWYQEFGDSTGRSTSSFLPVESTPIEAWRFSGGVLEAGPVQWGEVLLAVFEKRGTRTLYAFDVSSGDVLSKSGLGRGNLQWLGVWNSTVVLIDDGKVRPFNLRKGRLKAARIIKGPFAGEACFAEGRLVVTCTDEALRVIDIQRGKVIGQAPVPAGIVAYEEGKLIGARYGRVEGYEGEYLVMNVHELTFKDKSVVIGPSIEQQIAMTQRTDHARPPHYPVAIKFLPYGGSQWYIGSPTSLKTGDSREVGGALFAAFDTYLSSIKSRPAPLERGLLGFTGDGSLVRQGSRGETAMIVGSADVPPGAQAGPASIAGKVAYFGNWAVDLGTSRILWSEPKMDSVGPLIPVADRTLAYKSSAGELVVCVDPRKKGSDEVVTVHPTPTKPGSGSGLITIEGIRWSGVANEGPEGQWILSVADEEPKEFSAEDVALVESTSGAQLVGEGYPVLVAWQRRLSLDHQDMLDELSKAYVKKLFVGKAERLLEEAMQIGMPESRLAELRARIAGKRETTASNAPRQLRKLKADEAAARQVLMESHLDAARWCAKHGVLQVAAALLSHAQDLGPCKEAIVLAREWLPKNYPFVVNDSTPQHWIRWSRELVAAGAEFIPKGDPAWQRDEGALWGGAVIGLRTKNIEVRTLSNDPEVLGACLRSGEAALRTLERLLGREDSPASRERLQVRIHADRKSYLSEQTDSPFDRSWTAGYYSPSERISRFYVPAKNGSADASRRSLHKTFAHELTHQYLSQCWLPQQESASGSSWAAGFWIVEGFARFIEEQVVELGRLGGDLQDETAMSLDVSSGLLSGSNLIPADTFIRMSQLGFGKLPSDPIGSLKLRHSLLELQLTPKVIFYAQAGAMSYFMMHERGPEGRAGLIKYMREFYTTGVKKRGWKTLGFDSPDHMKEEFELFLGRIAKG